MRGVVLAFLETDAEHRSDPAARVGIIAQHAYEKNTSFDALNRRISAVSTVPYFDCSKLFYGTFDSQRRSAEKC